MVLALLAGASPAVAQHLVSGTVTEAATGEALIGAAVRERGTDNGAVTDLDGRYSLLVASPQATLEVSYVGEETQVEPVAGRAEVNVVMVASSAQLSQAIVTGYRGVQERRDLVGSYNTVSEEELAADRPVESVDQLLEGRVAGVQVQVVSGEPGLPIRVQIRGQSAVNANTSGLLLNASTQPLYILDGVPLFDVLETNSRASEFGAFNNQPLNPLSLINPDDIASIVVLKDASATALYGADAANGVVLITTKQGRSGATKVSVSANYGTGRSINEIKYLSTPEYLELARETLFNDGQNPADAGSSSIDTDWRQIVEQNPRNADVDLAVSGGNSGLTYRLTTGYSEVESVHVGNGLRQGNLNLNLQIPIGPKLKLSSRISGAYQRKEGLQTFGAFTFVPNIPVRNPDGTFNETGTFENRPNPAAVLEQNENYQRTISTNTQLTATYEPLPALTIRGFGGLDQEGRDQFQYRSALNASGRSRGGRLSLSDNRNLQWIANGQAVLTPKAFGRHHPSALLGGEASRQNQFRQVSVGSGFPFDDLRRLDLLPSEDTDVVTSVFERAKASYYGEVAYDYDYKYYVKLNGRRDASSLFGGDQQADLFWAVGTAWTFSQEAGFAERRPLGITYGKLRASYGITGNSRLGVYTAQGVYEQKFFADNYGGALPAFVTTPPNDALTWERKRQANLGLDLAWLDGKLTVVAEVYNNRTVDGLFTTRIPLEVGFESVVTNATSIRNRGYELTVGYEPGALLAVRGTGITYSTSFNFAHNYNRLLDIDQEVLVSTVSQRRLVPGTDLSLVYGVVTLPVNPETGQPRWRLLDGTITEDLVAARDPLNQGVIGKTAPDFFGGWHQRFGYGAFGLTLQINYTYGATELVDTRTFNDGRQIAFNNQSVNLLDRWQRAGDVTEVPRLSVDNPQVSNQSRYAYDLNYVEFSMISLDVDFGKLGIRTKHLETVRGFVLVNNLGYLYDGERTAGRNGIREYRFTFPEQRAFTAGLKVSW